MSIHDGTFHWLWTAWFVIIWIASCGYFAYRRKGRYSLWGVFVVITGAAVPLACHPHESPLIWGIMHLHAVASGLVVAGARAQTTEEYYHWEDFRRKAPNCSGMLAMIAWAGPMAMISIPLVCITLFRLVTFASTPTFPMFSNTQGLLLLAAACLIRAVPSFIAGVLCGAMLSLPVRTCAEWLEMSRLSRNDDPSPEPAGSTRSS